MEAMAGDLSRWMGAVSDVDHIHKSSKSPSMLKKMFAAQSVEQEAIEEIQMQLWLSDRNFSAPHIQRSRDPKDSAVHVAVREGNMEVLTWLVTKKNCSVCVFNDNEDGPLQSSAYKPLSRDIISFIHLAAAKEKATSGR